MIRLRRESFWRARQGSAAVEFAMVATAFVLFLFGILQFALLFLSRMAMHDALSDLATGDGTALLQAADRSGTRSFVCRKLLLVPTCTDSLKLEMRALNTASNDTVSNVFVKGASGTIMVVRAEASILVFVPFVPALRVRGKAVFLQPAAAPAS